MTALAEPGYGVGAPADDRPRVIGTPVSPGDRAFRGVLRGAGILVLVITGLIAVFLIIRASSALHLAGTRFFTETTWNPSTNHFGIATVLPDGIFIALVAAFFAIPVGIGAALFISEYSPHWARRGLIAIIDLMAAIPSILYALWGVYYVQPRMLGTTRWMSEHLGWIPIFKVRGPHQPSAFTSSGFLAGLVVSAVLIPIMASICREVFSQAPIGEREAAFALGASRWQMIRIVVLPFGKGGMIGALMLGFGRALGETIIVLLITSQGFELSWRLLEHHANSIPALIGNYYSDGTPGMLSALMAAGLMLFILTLVFNTLSAIVIARSRSGAETG